MTAPPPSILYKTSTLADKLLLVYRIDRNAMLHKGTCVNKKGSAELKNGPLGLPEIGLEELNVPHKLEPRTKSFVSSNYGHCRMRLYIQVAQRGLDPILF